MPERHQNNMPEGFEPPVPAWAADWSDQADRLTTAVFAVQGSVTEAFSRWLVMAMQQAEFAPEKIEQAQFTDQEGVVNMVWIGYWRNNHHDQWWSNEAVSGWWRDAHRLTDGVGYWREYYDMPIERLETLHSTDNSHGVANLAPTLEGPVKEHSYPGAARDRIYISGQEDVTSSATTQTKLLSVSHDGGQRVVVTPPAKMCVIRSGQDWGHCESEERDFYLNEVHPTLILGMNYLTENPDESRCLSMRLMQHTNDNGDMQPQTFGLGYALDILAFEDWAKSHPTHLKIFGTFMTHAQTFAENMKLRLWHEVTILDENSGEFEYINCHPKTGLLPYC